MKCPGQTHPAQMPITTTLFPRYGLIFEPTREEEVLKLEHLMRLSVQLDNPIPIGDIGRGTRSIGVASGGLFEGGRLRGTVAGPGADWVIVNDGGWGEMDVRLVLVTDDGANIYMHYSGVLEFNKAIRAALASSGETAVGDAYFVSQPRFETGSERYQWLNRTIAIGEGRVIPTGGEYEIYVCQPGQAAS